MVPSRSLAEVHYGDLKGRPFYDGLVSYMTSGKAPVIAMVRKKVINHRLGLGRN